MAFKLISSESLEVLADELSTCLYSGIDSVLGMPKVVIQSKGMEKWLSLRIAENLGITAGVEFLFLNGFFAEVVLAPYAEEHNLELSMLTPEHLKWIIFSLLNTIGDNPEFKVVARYIEGDQLKQLQIAEKLAEIYDRYSLYRSDWLCAWEMSGAGDYKGDERWLGELWRMIKQKTEMSSVAELSQLCLGWLASAESFTAAPVHFFGVSSMPPLYLQILAQASKRMDIFFYSLDVSHEYWGLVRSEKELLRTAGSNYEVGNTLLATFGVRNRDFLNLLVNFTADNGVEESERVVRGSIEDVTNEELPLLKRLQAGIRFMELPDWQSTVKCHDRSIEFHSCYGQMRQVQALYNSLLESFASDPELRPKDILVLTPAIKDFVPYIKAVFGSVERESEKYIPFTISDRAVLDDNRVCRGVLAVLKLFSGRFKVSEVWEVFSDPGFQESKNILPEAQEDILRWLNELQVHWGIDAKQREKVCGVKYLECSWQEVEERLLLGYAFGGSADNIFTLQDGRDVSGADVSGSVAALQSWLEFLSNLFSLNRRFARMTNAGDWIDFTRSVIEIFYANLDTEVQETLLSLSALEKLFADVGVSSSKMSFEVFLEELENTLVNTSSGAGFIMGGVTFCQFQPMRNIPAKVICMLGMDDGAFPRILRPAAFDIAAKQRRLCDPSLKLDDQGVFLETILSVADRLLIFYTGNGLKRGEKVVPSSVVAILRDYIGKHYLSENSGAVLEQITVSHPLQSFSKKYFQAAAAAPGNFLRSYSENDLGVCKDILGNLYAESFAYHITDSSIRESVSNSRYTLLSDLILFYKNPAKWYLQKRCNIYFDNVEDKLPADQDRFETDGGYHKGNLKKIIWSERISGISKIETRRKIISMRALPLGEYAQSEFETLYSSVDEVVKIMDKVGQTSPNDYTGVARIAVAADTGGDFGIGELGYMLPPLCSIEGTVVNIQFGFNASISWGYVVEFWIRHLLYSYICEDDFAFESRYYNSSGRLEYLFPRFSVAEAGKFLSMYLYGFYRGQIAPMAVFKYASTEYISKILAPRSPKTPEAALADARKKYVAPKSRSFTAFVDVDDQYIMQCFGADFTLVNEYCDDFRYCAETFVQPVFTHNIKKTTGKEE